MRYGFLTSEYPTTSPTKGGLATYTARMATLMARNNIEVHVFVLTDNRDDLIWVNGVYVHHLMRHGRSRLSALMSRFLSRIGLAGFNHYLKLNQDANQAAKYIFSFSSIRPLDVLQYSDYLGIGLRIRKKNITTLLVRCSSAIDLYMKADQRSCAQSRAQIKAEHRSIMKSDLIISPSQLVADHYAKLLAKTVKYVPPPAYLEAEISNTHPNWLPSKYFVHYAGWLLERKGSDLVLDALFIALSTCPEIRLVLIGTMTATIEQRYNYISRRYPSSIVYREPLPKSALYGIVQSSRAVILPSKIDNTPNTLLEALLLNSTVIVSKGSSLDDVVKGYEGATILDQHNAQQLAKIMINMWSDGNHSCEHRKPWLESEGGKCFEPREALRRHIEAIETHTS